MWPMPLSVYHILVSKSEFVQQENGDICMIAETLFLATVTS